jgi:hypothetical protein
MIMSNFYGKRFNAMSSAELSLLSLDIDLINLEKANLSNSPTYTKALLMREALVNKCEGGNYSRIEFVAQFNGTNPRIIETPFDECEIITLSLN